MVAGVLRAEDLDGGRLPGLGVVREVDRSHTAGADAVQRSVRTYARGQRHEELPVVYLLLEGIRQQQAESTGML